MFVWTCVHLWNKQQSTKSENSVFAKFVHILQVKCTKEQYHSKERWILYIMRFGSRVLKRRFWVILWHQKKLGLIFIKTRSTWTIESFKNDALASWLNSIAFCYLSTCIGYIGCSNGEALYGYTIANNRLFQIQVLLYRNPSAAI